jgi:hypothetical protein
MTPAFVSTKTASELLGIAEQRLRGDRENMRENEHYRMVGQNISWNLQKLREYYGVVSVAQDIKSLIPEIAAEVVRQLKAEGLILRVVREEGL